MSKDSTGGEVEFVFPQITFSMSKTNSQYERAPLCQVTLSSEFKAIATFKIGEIERIIICRSRIGENSQVNSVEKEQWGQKGVSEEGNFVLRFSSGKQTLSILYVQ